MRPYLSSKKRRGVVEIEAILISMVCATAAVALMNMVFDAKSQWESKVEAEAEN